MLNKVYIDVELQPKPIFDERKAFINMLEKQEYKTKTLFIADRGYPSWNVFSHFKYSLDFYRGLVETVNVFKLMSKYILPIRLGRTDKRKKKPKSFISFTYRVA